MVAASDGQRHSPHGQTCYAYGCTPMHLAGCATSHPSPDAGALFRGVGLATGCRMAMAPPHTVSPLPGPAFMHIFLMGPNTLHLNLRHISLLAVGWSANDIQTPGDVGILEAGLARQPQAILVLDLGNGEDTQPLNWISDITQRWPALQVVLLVRQASEGLLTQALHSGACEVLESPPEPRSLVQTLQRLSAQDLNAPPRPPARPRRCWPSWAARAAAAPPCWPATWPGCWPPSLNVTAPSWTSIGCMATPLSTWPAARPGTTWTNWYNWAPDWTPGNCATACTLCTHACACWPPPTRRAPSRASRPRRCCACWARCASNASSWCWMCLVSSMSCLWRPCKWPTTPSWCCATACPMCAMPSACCSSCCRAAWPPAAWSHCSTVWVKKTA